MALLNSPEDFSKDRSIKSTSWVHENIITHRDIWGAMAPQIQANNAHNVESLFVVAVLLSHGICDGDKSHNAQHASHALQWLERFSENGLSRAIDINDEIAACFTRAVLNVNDFGKAHEGIELVRAHSKSTIVAPA